MIELHYDNGCCACASSGRSCARRLRGCVWWWGVRVGSKAGASVISERTLFGDDVLVRLLKVLGQDDIAVLAHGKHAGLLADGRNVGARDFVWAAHVILQVNLQGKHKHTETQTRSMRC